MEKEKEGYPVKASKSRRDRIAAMADFCGKVDIAASEAGSKGDFDFAAAYHQAEIAARAQKALGELRATLLPSRAESGDDA